MSESTTTAQASQPSPAEPVAAGTGLIIGVLVVSAFVMILNETIVSVALPDLARTLSVSATTIQWLASGFLVAMAVVIPTTGFLLDRVRPRAVFLTSMSSFALGTLVCALAPNFEVLLLGRIVQACGTAVMVPLLLTTVMRLIPPERRGAMMGTISIVIAAAPAVGPTIGGAILAGLGWRWMFWLVLVLAVAMLAIGIARMRVPAETRRVPLDLASVLLSAVGFAGVVYGFSTIGQADGQFVPAWVPLVIGVVVLAAFAARQLRLQRRDRALLNLRPLSQWQFSVALVLSVLMFMALLGAGAILLPMYMQDVLRFSTFVTGLSLLPGGLLLAALSRPVGRLFDRVGARPLVIPGSVGMAVALWLFAVLGAGAPLAAIIGVDMLLMGSLGLMMTPLMAEALGVLPDTLYSHGSAILTTLQQVAGALGSAVFVAVAALGSGAGAGSPDAGGMRLAFAVAGCIGLLAVAVTFLLRRRRPTVAEPEESQPDLSGVS